MQKAEIRKEWVLKIKTHVEDVTATLFINLDIHRCDILSFQNNKVEFKVDIPEGHDSKCKVQVQKETSEGGMVDDACGEYSPKGYAGYCK